MKDANENTGIYEKRDRRVPRLTPDEAGRLGKEIYRREIRHKVEPELVGKYVAIDVESGCWALGESTMGARDKLAELRPDAIDVWMEWIGYEAVFSIGGGPLRRTNWSKE